MAKDQPNLQQWIQQQIAETIAIKQKMAESCSGVLLDVSDKMIHCLQHAGVIYLCGNGGSACDAEHVATELVGRYLRERRPLPAVALTTNTALLTALANDYDYSQVFARQVRASMNKNDILVAISTSGKSANVINAVLAAHELGAFTIGFTGVPGQPLASHTDLCLCVPSTSTPRIQEAHIVAWHIICDLIEQAFLPA
jgi:D-sedoheptulose 7-phosphate isomerase